MSGRTSATAELIALGTIFLSRDPRLGQLVPEKSSAMAELLVSASAPHKLALIRLAGKPGLRWVVRVIEGAVLPGILLHYTLRKRFIEENVRAFLDRGGQQLVVLGAGFDTLAARLAEEHPSVSCIEIDHPGTQQTKRQALAATGRAGLHLAPADLARDRIDDVLVSIPAFVPDRPTFFVLEGVSMYLDETSVARVLGECARLGGPGTRIAWTFMSPGEHGRIAFRRSRSGLVDSWLRSRGEPFTWGIRRERLEHFLGALGLSVLEVAGPATLRDRYLTPLALEAVLAEGEECALCEKR
jgi:methyltransferase (TIGR00027 family)